MALLQVETLNILHLVRDRCVTNPFLLVGILQFNAWIAWCYIDIPRRLQRIRRRCGGGNVAPNGQVRQAAVFVACCGITHVLTMGTLFFPFLDWPAVFWGNFTGWMSWKMVRLLAATEDDIVRLVLDTQRLKESVERHEA